MSCLASRSLPTVGVPPVWFGDLRSVMCLPTLRMPRRFAARHPSLFPCSTSARSGWPSTVPPSRRNGRVRGFILPWSLPLRRTLAFHLAVTFRIPHSLSGFSASVAVVPKPKSGVVRRSVTVQGFDPSSTAAETLVALRLPPCRWTRTLTGKPAATLFTLDFEVLIRLGGRWLPSGCPSGHRHPLFRFALSG